MVRLALVMLLLLLLLMMLVLSSFPHCEWGFSQTCASHKRFFSTKIYRRRWRRRRRRWKRAKKNAQADSMLFIVLFTFCSVLLSISVVAVSVVVLFVCVVFRVFVRNIFRLILSRMLRQEVVTAIELLSLALSLSLSVRPAPARCVFCLCWIKICILLCSVTQTHTPFSMPFAPRWYEFLGLDGWSATERMRRTKSRQMQKQDAIEMCVYIKWHRPISLQTWKWLLATDGADKAR